MENKLINWQDGMNISEIHFKESDKFFVEKIGLLSKDLLPFYNWGLVEKPAIQDYLTIKEISKNRLLISVFPSRYFSSKGTSIEINEGDCIEEIINIKENSFFKEKDKRIAIMLKINPFEFEVSGKVDLDEEPPRYPYLNQQIIITLALESYIKSIKSDYVLIGLLKFYNDEWILDDTFIPPCRKIDCVSLLSEKFNFILKNLERASVLSAQIMAKITLQGMQYPLALNLYDFSINIMSFAISQKFELNMYKSDMDPFTLRKIFGYLSGRLYVFITKLSTADRGEILSYFYEWCLISPGNFLGVIEDVHYPDYKHNNIKDSMRKIEDLMRMLLVILEKMNQLEFIGERKENIIISKQ